MAGLFVALLAAASFTAASRSYDLTIAAALSELELIASLAASDLAHSLGKRRPRQPHQASAAQMRWPTAGRSSSAIAKAVSSPAIFRPGSVRTLAAAYRRQSSDARSQSGASALASLWPRAAMQSRRCGGSPNPSAALRSSTHSTRSWRNGARTLGARHSLCFRPALSFWRLPPLISGRRVARAVQRRPATAFADEWTRRSAEAAAACGIGTSRAAACSGRNRCFRCSA